MIANTYRVCLPRRTHGIEAIFTEPAEGTTPLLCLVEKRKETVESKPQAWRALSFVTGVCRLLYMRVLQQLYSTEMNFTCHHG